MASCTPSYLFVPNLIGYVRIVTQLISYAYALDDCRIAVSCYLLAQALDAVDGFAARSLNQASELGRVLDMVTDRASTICLCLVLSHLYPRRILFFALLVTLDLFSHWYHMHATLISASVSHKGSPNWVVRLYYRKPVLFSICAATELWYVSWQLPSLRAASWSGKPSLGAKQRIVSNASRVQLPSCTCGRYVSLYAMHFAPDWLLVMLPFAPFEVPVVGLSMPSVAPFWLVVFVVSTPLAAFKQVTNVVQLIEAGRVLTRLDAERREEAQQLRADSKSQ